MYGEEAVVKSYEGGVALEVGNLVLSGYLKYLTSITRGLIVFF